MKTGAMWKIHKTLWGWSYEFFRPDCDRTYCDGYGNSKGRLDLINWCEDKGWLLFENPNFKSGMSQEQVKQWAIDNQHKSLTTHKVEKK